MERGDHVQSSGQSLDEFWSFAALCHRHLNPFVLARFRRGSVDPAVAGAVRGGARNKFTTRREVVCRPAPVKGPSCAVVGAASGLNSRSRRRADRLADTSPRGLIVSGVSLDIKQV
ncbi:hypothetical protein Pmi06nite_52730 [Planotetraspora mira]|uniref:Uncharacterized protein n=1 Tax=Planotetraspora mira TaxID=58121 RepID=A0A8J3TTG3_9ACTN|nr:hypothetical protein Pmi06nite_52730 [Planotetraspora mira]